MIERPCTLYKIPLSTLPYPLKKCQVETNSLSNNFLGLNFLFIYKRAAEIYSPPLLASKKICVTALFYKQSDALPAYFDW